MNSSPHWPSVLLGILIGAFGCFILTQHRPKSTDNHSLQTSSYAIGWTEGYIRAQEAQLSKDFSIGYVYKSLDRDTLAFKKSLK
jgi:hypothetical protein